MNDRELLEAALADADYRLEQGNSISPAYVDQTLFALANAGRERLRQLPPYTSESVEQIRARLDVRYYISHEQVIAMLDALNLWAQDRRAGV